MPGDLTNPEFFFPFHYDPRYEPGSNTFDSRPLSIDEILQAVAKEKRGYPLNKYELSQAQGFLKSKNLLLRNPGDEKVRECAEKFMDTLKTARKVAARWLI